MSGLVEGWLFLSDPTIEVIRERRDNKVWKKSHKVS